MKEAVQERLRGDEQLVIYLPFSDMMPEGIYEQDDIFKALVSLLPPTGRHFPPERINHVRALGLLTHVGPDPENQYFTSFEHTRFFHTLLVARTGEKILRNNNASESDIKTFIASAILHDAATPALGDATKAVDPANLDEEEFWWEGVTPKGWSYLESIGATKEKIDDVIKNKGILGRTLDIADRIAYVMRDLYTFQSEPAVSAILSNYPQIGNIYKDLVVDFEGEEVYFKDPETLGTFLLLRGFLNKNLYLHPVNMGRDLKFANLLNPYYSTTAKEGKLNPTMLRQMTDQELMEWLEKAQGIEAMSPGHSYFDFIRWFPHFKKFSTLKGAETQKSKLEKDSKFQVIGIKESKGFNPGVSYKVKDEYGRIVEYKKAEPESARMLETLAQSTKGFFVFFQEAS
ncbi:MAG TPA: hypothetical protein VKC89_02465 [Patescibacteria group bacterium]|nr:hypothetical protein [Patescibacteria group bacterium]